MKKFLILALAAALAMPAFAADDAKQEKKERKLTGFFKKYDKDGDGKLNDEEKAAMKADRSKKRAEMIEKYDTNKDGKLDKEERAKAKADRAAKKAERKEKKAKKEAAAPAEKK